MSKNNKILTGEIKQGNRCALKKIYDRYHRQLYYIAIQYLKDEALAEDAVQDVFLKVWNKRKSLDQTSSIEGFLFTVLKNHLLNMIRDEKKRQQILEEVKRSAQIQKPFSNAEDKLIYDEYKKALNKAIDKLSPAKREVFKLRSMEGLTNGEIAEKRKVSKHTVKTQYYLGSKEIMNFLKKNSILLLAIGILFQI